MFEQRPTIRPAAVEEVKKFADDAYAFAANASDETYGRGRRSYDLLEGGGGYAQLPSCGGVSPRSLLAQLPADSAILDVGCGYGQFGADVLASINPCVSVYGFDAQRQRGQERLTHVAVGNVDDLSQDTFGSGRFDAVVSSALLYHVPDYWGAFLRMTRLLAPGGFVLASTVPRVMRAPEEAADNEQGLTEENNTSLAYFRDRNVFNTRGMLVPTAELVQKLNARNNGFTLEYHVIDAPGVPAVQKVGGQLSGRKRDAGSLNLTRLFYCIYNGMLGYVYADTEKECIELVGRGFMSVHERVGA